ncbi:hypothetical protein LguiA_034510 [Lonicera macranthoides]
MAIGGGGRSTATHDGRGETPTSSRNNFKRRFQFSASNYNWSTLPQELLDLILKKIVSLTDYLHFTTTCHYWCSAALADRHNRIDGNNTQLPFLLIPSPPNNSPNTRKIYNITRNTHLDIELPLSVPFNKGFCGSSHGWLIFFDHQTLTFSLINPFSSRIINVSSFTNDLPFHDLDGENDQLHEYNVLKAVLSVDPNSSPEEYCLVVIYGYSNWLAFYKSCDKSWALKNRHYNGFHDVIFSKSQDLFYAINDLLGLYIFSISQPYNVKMILRRPIVPRVPKPSVPRRYLVESPDGDLLEILRLFSTGEDRDLRFRVLKIRKSEKWVEMETLGDWSLFLGDNHSLCVQASDYVGCRRGCIYFAMEMSEVHNVDTYCKPNLPIQMFAYNLEEKHICMYYLLEPGDDHEGDLSPPIWIVPTLKRN